MNYDQLAFNLYGVNAFYFIFELSIKQLILLVNEEVPWVKTINLQKNTKR